MNYRDEFIHACNVLFARLPVELRSLGPSHWARCALLIAYLDAIDGLKWRQRDVDPGATVAGIVRARTAQNQNQFGTFGWTLGLWCARTVHALPLPFFQRHRQNVTCLVTCPVGEMP